MKRCCSVSFQRPSGYHFEAVIQIALASPAVAKNYRLIARLERKAPQLLIPLAVSWMCPTIPIIHQRTFLADLSDLASDRCDHFDASVAHGRWRNGGKTLAIFIGVYNELWWCLLPFDSQSAAPTMNSTTRRPRRVGRAAADSVPNSTICK